MGEVVTISDAETLSALAPEIEHLHTRVGFPYSPVAHPSWLLAWMGSQSPNERTSCFLVRGELGLEVCVPLTFSRLPYAGLRVPKAETMSLAWGWSSALIAPDADDAWLEQFCTWMREVSQRWSVLEMGAFPSASLQVRKLTTQWAGPWHRTESFRRDMAILVNRGGWERTVASPDRSRLRRNVRRLQRRAESEGTLTHVEPAPSPEWILSTLDSVSTQSWQGAHQSSVFTSRPGFYRELAARQEPGFNLALATLTTEGGQPIAYSLSACVGSVTHGIDTAYDPAYSRLSPGLLAIVASIDQALGLGTEAFDLGEMADYKRNYAPTLVKGLQVRVTKPAATLRSKLTATRQRPSAG